MKYILWDFDDTLAYRDGKWGSALIQALDLSVADHGIVKEDVRPYLQQNFPWHTPEIPHPQFQTSDQWWELLYPILSNALISVGVEHAVADAVAMNVRNTYTDPQTWNVYDDTHNTLQELRGSGWKHIILSNHVPELPQLVQSLELGGYFEAILTSAVIGYEKPHPNAYRSALDMIGKSDYVCMIGDSMNADVYGAHQVGIDAVLVRKFAEEATYFSPDLNGIHPILEMLESA